MSRIILLYSTTDGHTLKICKFLQSIIEQHNHQISLNPVEQFDGDLSSFDKIILGASIHYGKHHQSVYDFIEKNQKILEKSSNAFFSVNLVARKPDKNQPHNNPYLKKFLTQISWKPEALAVFAGKLDYQRYSFWDRQMIRLIMWITKGPTDLNSKIEFTDWQQVESFGHNIAKI